MNGHHFSTADQKGPAAADELMDNQCRRYPKTSKDSRVTTPLLPPATGSPAEVYAGRRAARHDERRRLARRYFLLSGGRRLFLGALVILIVLGEHEACPEALAEEARERGLADPDRPLDRDVARRRSHLVPSV